MQNHNGSLGQRLLALSRTVKRLISISVDFVSLIVSMWFAFSLRLGEFYQPPPEQIWIFILAPFIAIPIFIKFGLYRAIIRYISFDALGTVVKAVVLFSLIYALIILMSGDLAGVVPRTVFAINALILLLIVGGTRMFARWLFNHQALIRSEVLDNFRFIPPVLIYGAGTAGVQLASALSVSRRMRPVAFIDDNETLHHHRVAGVTVFSCEELPQLIEKYQVSDILLALPSVSRYQRSFIINKLAKYPIHVRTIPNLVDIAEGKIAFSDIQEVPIDDLLGREVVAPITDLLTANVSGKVLMITGAGGSIGSELTRQLASLNPKKIILFEQSEYNLYKIEQEIQRRNTDVELISVLGTVVDKQHMLDVCERFKVQTIYHAAAYKHVPLVEKNMEQGIQNNVFGTLHCAQAAVAAGVETFVLVSTDKAVRPTNIMGASKRLAELILQALSMSKDLSQNTRFTMVRFGNVLDSSGSVVPLFREQIAAGGPVTVTHPEIIRYFMTIPEASQLVIQAGAMGMGGDVFVLDMGEPVKIADLAEKMIRLSGFSIRDEMHPKGDIEIAYTGLRAGEKLYEELLIGDTVSATEHEKILRAKEQVIPWAELSTILDRLSEIIQNERHDELRQLLLDTIDGYQPQSATDDC
jgi:FlaA1/EpsC-like NDP-sugar epimerase